MRWPDFWGYEGYKVADRMCKVQKCHRYSQKNGAYKSRPTFTFQGRLLDLLQDALTRSLVRFPFDTFPVALAVAKDRHRLHRVWQRHKLGGPSMLGNVRHDTSARINERA